MATRRTGPRAPGAEGKAESVRSTTTPIVSARTVEGMVNTPMPAESANHETRECPDCGGDGSYADPITLGQTDCPRCHGTGRVPAPSHTERGGGPDEETEVDRLVAIHNKLIADCEKSGTTPTASSGATKNPVCDSDGQEDENSELNVRDTAQRLGVSENTIRNWAERGVLPPSRVLPSGFRRFSSADVERMRAEMWQGFETREPLLGEES